jgi:hypothetical protein
MKIIRVFILFTLLFRCTNGKRLAIGKHDEFKRQVDAGHYSYQDAKSIGKFLNLDSIENGYDSLQIRLWIYPALLNRRDLYLLKRAKGRWSAMHYVVAVESESEADRIRYILKDSATVAPMSGWNQFIETVYALDIITLPNMEQIPINDNIYDDGWNYSIELATKKFYRFYSSMSLKNFKQSIPKQEKWCKLYN